MGGIVERGEQGVGSTLKMAGRKVKGMGEGGGGKTAEGVERGLAGGIGRGIDEVVSIIWGGRGGV